MSSACIQGGSLGPLRYQPSTIMDQQLQHAWQFANQIQHQEIKQEPIMDEDKNDSGITSGSDFHSSSPGSDNSQDLQHQFHQAPQPARIYSTPLISKAFLQHPYQHNPLTPPNSEPLVSPKGEDKDMDTTITPCSSPQRTKGDENQDHLRRLEMSLEKSGLFTSENSEHSFDGDKTEGDEFDDQGIRIPKVNSHGKVKTFKCKQCEFVAITKLEFWEHSKTHIREDKRLTCPKCPFVTEYKHHLEYHLRNHTGSKPFKCNKCEYSCVNKSMLNSHMKSHSNVYQFRCNDCSYAVKYMHSLKLHLRKYSHRPAVVLNPDGTPNPLPIIDVYGTRRGPKLKTQQNYKPEEQQNENVPFFNQLLGSNPQQLPFPAYPFLSAQLLQNFQHMLLERQQSLASSTTEEPSEDNSQAVLDLSKPLEQKNRRKGPAYKLDNLMNTTESDEEEEEEEETTMLSNVETVFKPNREETEKEYESSEDERVSSNNNKGESNSCQYCDIAFGDPVLYTMHMGYHGFKNPFACNMCGVECVDKVSFFLHIARTSHS